MKRLLIVLLSVALISCGKNDTAAPAAADATAKGSKKSMTCSPGKAALPASPDAAIANKTKIVF
jgi:hypothetical protein